MAVDKGGIRWACRICIRGHRVLKCQHFERPMRRVRKVGRPLTQCPHAGASNCQCGELWCVMAPVPNERYLCEFVRVVAQSQTQAPCVLQWQPSAEPNVMMTVATRPRKRINGPMPSDSLEPSLPESKGKGDDDDFLIAQGKALCRPTEGVE